MPTTSNGEALVAYAYEHASEGDIGALDPARPGGRDQSPQPRVLGSAVDRHGRFAGSSDPSACRINGLLERGKAPQQAVARRDRRVQANRS